MVQEGLDAVLECFRLVLQALGLARHFDVALNTRPGLGADLVDPVSEAEQSIAQECGDV